MSYPPPPEPMPSERPTRLLVNGEELLKIQATPISLDDWAVGFLFTEGIIHSPGDLLSLEVAASDIRVEVSPERLASRELPRTRYLTSGCGKGVTFSSVKDALLRQPVQHDLQVTRQQLLTWMKQVQRQTPLYQESGGMHAAAAVKVPTGEMLVREDIGRHNAVDKAIGASLKAGWDPCGVVILTTGRISYEMCSKLARYGVAVGASLTAATDQASRMAVKLGIDLVGYTRSLAKMVLYTEGKHIRDEA